MGLLGRSNSFNKKILGGAPGCAAHRQPYIEGLREGIIGVVRGVAGSYWNRKRATAEAEMEMISKTNSVQMNTIQYTFHAPLQPS